jgi:hypothetical protein
MAGLPWLALLFAGLGYITDLARTSVRSPTPSQAAASTRVRPRSALSTKHLASSPIGLSGPSVTATKADRSIALWSDMISIRCKSRATSNDTRGRRRQHNSSPPQIISQAPLTLLFRRAINTAMQRRSVPWGEQFSAECKRKGITQSELARRLNCSKQMISLVMARVRAPCPAYRTVAERAVELVKSIEEASR